MELSRYVVEAVVLEGRSYRSVAAAHGVSKSWVGKLVARYRQGGYEALRSRSRAPHRTPHRTSPELEDAILALRKHLTEAGFDAGAHTIHYHLERQGLSPPSVSTIWRVLRRRGFVVPQPHKRPRSSWNRFEASLPNECWQSDVTHWRLADGAEVEICNFIDDYSRCVVSSRVFAVTTAPIVVGVFRQAAAVWGYPANVLTDNGCIYTARYRGGAAALEIELLSLGIRLKHSAPYHPQTCGKVERFHQTLKVFLRRQDPATSIEELQAQVDRFITYYNQVRPHRARGRMTPRQAYESRAKARPAGPRIDVPQGVRVRHDKVDSAGKLTLRRAGTLHHIGIGREHRHKRVIMLIAGLDIKVLTEDGVLLRRLTLDTSKIYQATGLPKGRPKGFKVVHRR